VQLQAGRAAVGTGGWLTEGRGGRLGPKAAKGRLLLRRGRRPEAAAAKSRSRRRRLLPKPKTGVGASTAKAARAASERGGAAPEGWCVAANGWRAAAKRRRRGTKGWCAGAKDGRGRAKGGCAGGSGGAKLEAGGGGGGSRAKLEAACRGAVAAVLHFCRQLREGAGGEWRLGVARRS
jgi:hypothetical protein